MDVADSQDLFDDAEDGLFDFMDENADAEEDAFVEEESRYFNCHVCGDNWITIKEVDIAGKCQITFIHQMGMLPLLKRVANMQTQVLLNEQTVDEWQYFLNDEPVTENDWMDKLSARRKVLKSVCTN